MRTPEAVEGVGGASAGFVVVTQDCGTGAASSAGKSNTQSLSMNSYPKSILRPRSDSRK